MIELSVDEDDVKFVMQHAQRGSDDSGVIARSEMQQAISLWRYLQHERKLLRYIHKTRAVRLPFPELR